MRVPKTAFPEDWLTLGLGIPGGLHILSLISKAPEGGTFIPCAQLDSPQFSPEKKRSNS